MNALFEDLDYSDDCVYLYQGEPFTGIAEERFPNGKIRCVFPFETGKENGDVKEFYPSGVLMGCTPYRNGIIHGIDTEWFETGAVKQEMSFEFGILLQSRTFDESGAIVDEYVRPQDGLREIVQLKRRRNQ